MILNPLTYALLAQEAYSAPPQIGIEDSAARAVEAHTIDGMAFAFPGTNNVQCVIADADIRVVQVPGLGGLHAGFREAFLSIAGDLHAAADASGVPTIPCGHSEGAALALNFAGDLCLRGRPPKAVFAFEPPRVSTDPVLGRLLAAHGVRVFCYRKGNDIVPMLPLDIFRAWQHPAPLIRVGAPACPFDNEEDHEIAGVVEAIKGMVLANAGAV